MARQEELVERYEDALFTLLMNGVAEAEGKRLLEESAELKKDPSAAVPERVNRRCIRTINRAFAREKRIAFQRTSRRVLQRAAIVAVASALLLTVACAISPTLRTKTLNLLIQVSEIATSMQMKDDAGVPAVPEDEGVVLMGYRFPAPPEGFEKVNESISDECENVIYQDENGAGIEFNVRRADGKILDVDTENAQAVEAITIRGHEGVLAEKRYEFEGKVKNKISIAWGDRKQNMFLEIKVSNLDRETAIAFAKEVESIERPEE